jgi:hypothetical protein
VPDLVRSRRIVPLLAIVLQLCLGWTSLAALLHDDNDDPACNPVLVLHDHNAHHVGARHGAPAESEHCFICHNQSLRSLVAGADSWTPAGTTEVLLADLDTGTSATVLARRPARAPPLA